MNSPLTTNKSVLSFVDQNEKLCKPTSVVWIDGSQSQLDTLRGLALKSGELIELNQEILPRCYLHRSAINDVARVENRTYICSENKADAGPLNNWLSPTEAKEKLTSLFDGAMKGRTMYVIPFSMGVVGSPFSKIGIEITDSIYVVINMSIMARVGKASLDALGASNDFVRCLHSVGTLSEEDRYICHFPTDNAIWSINSGYGGNALLGKKCLALRIASCQAKREGWLAEHMLIIGIEKPGQEVKYIAAAFPSQCGKTNLAMLIPPDEFAKKGYKVWCVGDDIAWLRIGEDGRLWAVNPENGFFGVAPGTSAKTNPNAVKMVQHDTIFTNVVHDLDTNTVWWEGLDTPPPTNALNWKGEKFNFDEAVKNGNPGAHANSRFTVGIKNCPVLSSEAENPKGVPISAILFGGRRTETVPLVYGAFDWNHGVFIGATMGSTTTAAQQGAIGVTRRDPMAMLPFIGYNVGDYLSHWVEMGKKMKNPPMIFNVNWFRKDESGKFVWPGFGENLRVLDWVFNYLENGEKVADKTAIGFVPKQDKLCVDGLDISKEKLAGLLKIEIDGWKKEVKEIGEFFNKIDDGRLPTQMKEQLANLQTRIG
ncbi:MAG: phosphoenolpyruvate carboxykinase (GTP) [Firmicutes bacterium]|nr:phosphoenolpyruvate carboxykinase (GTP) [Bacillota bacterium]